MSELLDFINRVEAAEGQAELVQPKGYSEWSQENTFDDKLESRVRYGDYVREQYIDNDAYNAEIESQIFEGYTASLIQDGVLLEDGSNATEVDELSKKYDSRGSFDDQAKFFRDSLDSRSDDWKTLTNYLAATNVADPTEDYLNTTVANLREEAEEVLSKNYDRLLEQKVDSGELAVAKLSSGQLYIGDSIETMGTVAALKQGAPTGVTMRDALKLDQLMQNPEGYDIPLYKLLKVIEVKKAIDDDLRLNEEFQIIAEGVTRRAGDKEDKSFSDRAFGLFRGAFRQFKKAFHSAAHGANPLAPPTFLLRKGMEARGVEIPEYEVSDPEKRLQAVDRAKGTKLEDLVSEYSDRLGFNPSDVMPALKQSLLEYGTEKGFYRFHEDEEDLGKNIRKGGFGLPYVPTQLSFKKDLFEKALAARNDLTPEIKEALSVQRVERLKAGFQQTNDFLLTTYKANDWSNAVLAGQQAGLQPYEILEDYLADDDNYSHFGNRALGLGFAALDTIAALPMAVGGIFDKEASAEYFSGMADMRAKRRRVAAMFGDEYGFVSELAETALPMVGDIAATAMITAATGGAGAGAGAALFAARTAAKSGAKFTLSGFGKAAVGQTFKTSAVRDSKSLADELLKAGVVGTRTKTGVKKVTKDGLDEASDSLTKKLILVSDPDKAASQLTSFLDDFNKKHIARVMGDMIGPSTMPLMATAGTRSGSATYGQVYGQLIDEGNSREEAHDKALGAAMQAGAFTGILTASFSRIGFGGLESVLGRGLSYSQLNKVGDFLISKAKGIKGTFKTTTGEKVKFSDLLEAELKENLKKSAGLAGAAKAVFYPAGQEAVEEGIDELVTSMFADAALNENAPLEQQLKQTFMAAMMGAALGGAVPTIQAAKRLISPNVADARRSAMDSLIVAAASKLEASDSKEAAKALREQFLNLGRSKEQNLDERVALSLARGQGVTQETETTEAETPPPLPVSDTATTVEESAENLSEPTPTVTPTPEDTTSPVEPEVNAESVPETPRKAPAPQRGAAPQLADVESKLAKAAPKPVHNGLQREVRFASLLDKAAYIVRRSSKSRSKNFDAFLNYAMQQSGMTEQQVRQHGDEVNTYIANRAEEGGTVLEIPALFTNKEQAAAPPREQLELNLKDEASPKSIRSALAAVTSSATVDSETVSPRVLARKRGLASGLGADPVQNSAVEGSDHQAFRDTAAGLEGVVYSEPEPSTILEQDPEKSEQAEQIEQTFTDKVNEVRQAEAEETITPEEAKAQKRTAFRERNKSLNALRVPRTVESNEEVDPEEDAAVDRLIATGFPYVLTPAKLARLGVPVSERTLSKKFIEDSNAKIQRETSRRFPVTDVKTPEGGYAVTTLTDVKAQVGPDQVGIFNNDPQSMATLMEQGTPIRVPESVINATTTNPSFRFAQIGDQFVVSDIVLSESGGQVSALAPSDKVLTLREDYSTLQGLIEQVAEIRESRSADQDATTLIRSPFDNDQEITVEEALDLLSNEENLRRFIPESLTPTVEQTALLDLQLRGMNAVMRGQEPSMISLGREITQEYTKMQDARSEHLKQSYIATVPVDAAPALEQNENFSPEQEISDPYQPFPVLPAEQLPTRKIASTIKDAQDQAIEAMAADPEIRAAVLNILEQEVYQSSSINFSKMTNKEAWGLFTNWMAQGNNQSNVVSLDFQQALKTDLFEMGAPVRKALNILSLSAKSVEGDPMQDSGYRQTFEVSLQQLLGRTPTPPEINAFIASIEKAKSDLYLRSENADFSLEEIQEANLEEILALGLENNNPDSILEALRRIIESSSEAESEYDQHLVVLARLLIQNPSFLADLSFTIDRTNLDYAGRMRIQDDGTRAISININGRNPRGVADTLLHEVTHAYVSNITRKPKAELTRRERSALAVLDNVLNQVREQFSNQSMGGFGGTTFVSTGYDNHDSRMYDALENVDEFIAHFLTNIKFQQAVKVLSDPSRAVGVRKRNVFEVIIDAILGLFPNLARAQYPKFRKAFSAVLDLAHTSVLAGLPNTKRAASMSTQDFASLQRDGMTATKEIPPKAKKYIANRVFKTQAVTPQPSLAVPLTSSSLASNAAEKVSSDRRSTVGLSSGLEGATGTERTAKQEHEQRKQEYADLVRRIVPPDIEVQVDETIKGQAEVDVETGVMRVNPNKIIEYLQSLVERNGGEPVPVREIVEVVIDEEISHAASVAALSESEIDAISSALTLSDVNEVLAQYGNQDSIREDLKARFLEGDPDARLIIAEEMLRIFGQRSRMGFTTEEQAEFLSRNPGNKDILMRYLKGHFRRKKFERNMKNLSPKVRTAIERTRIQLRALQEGYVYKSRALQFDPENPAATIEEFMRQLDINNRVAAGVDAPQPEEDQTAPARAASGLGINAQTEGASDFPESLNVDDDLIDFNHMELLEIPVIAKTDAAYEKSKSLFSKLFVRTADPTVVRFLRERDNFIKANDNLIGRFYQSYKEAMKEEFGDNVPPSDDIFWTMLQQATGSRTVVPDEARVKELEDSIAQASAVITINRDQGIIDDAEAETQRAALRARQAEGMQDLRVQAREKAKAERNEGLQYLKDTHRSVYTVVLNLRNLTDKMSASAKVLFGGDGVDLRFDNQMGVYITRTYQMFMNPDYIDMIKTSDSAEAVNIRQAAIQFMRDVFISQETQRLITEGATVSEAEQQAKQLYDEAEVGGASKGHQMMIEFLDAYGSANSARDFADAFDLAEGSAIRIEGTSDGLKALVDNLKKRKELPEALANLMGANNIKEDSVNDLVYSLGMVSRIAAHQSFLQKLKAQGQAGGWLLTAPQVEELKESNFAEGSKYRRVKSDKADMGNNPLADLYATEDIIEELKVLMQPISRTGSDATSQTLNNIMGYMHKFTGYSMGAKTLLSFGFYLRNALSNIMFFGPAQGFYGSFRLLKIGGKYGAGDMFRRAIGSGSVRDTDAYLSRLEATGVFGNEIRSQIMIRLMRGEESMNSLQAKLSELSKQAKNPNVTGAALRQIRDNLGRIASAMDSFYKIAYFEHEKKVLLEARAHDIKTGKFNKENPPPSDTQIEQDAADIVSATAQSYDRALPIIKKITTETNFGLLFAPFIRFTAEIPRITANTIRLARKEMKSDNPVIRARGKKRIRGFIGTVGLVSMVLPTLLRAVVGGIGRDEDEAIRASLPVYLRNHTFFYFKRPGSDQLRSLDLTYMNPFSMIADPSLRFMEHLFRGEPIEGVQKAVMTGVFAPFLGQQILSGAVFDVLENRQASNDAPIYEESEDFNSKIGKSLGYILREAYGGRTPKKVMEAYRTAVEGGEAHFLDSPMGLILQEAMPVTSRPVDPKRQFERTLYALRDEYSRARRMYNELGADKAMSDKQIADLYKDTKERMMEINASLGTAIRGFGSFMSEGEMYRAMRKAKYGETRSQLLFAGYQERYLPSKPLMQRLVQTPNGEARLRKLLETAMQDPRFIEIDQ
tara:strand:- start:911 stop:11269 length:10359 start_codon:yes stop_codon:yes gene_type:complete